jgi:citrate synthase
LTFALGVEKVTSSKKGNLILNVDGAIAAILLDILESEMGYSHEELKELVEIEFFNALFVLARSVGFSAHYLDQRRHDEGLLRLSPNEIRYIGE